MIASLRAELRKLFTVRSTYILSVIGVLIGAGLAAGFAFGYQDAGSAVRNADALETALYTGLGFAVTFASIIAILLVGHEYRYNTILYSLTNINHRHKLLVSKFVSIVAFGLALSFVTVALSLVAFYVGQSLRSGPEMVAQQVAVFELLWRAVLSTVVNLALVFVIAVIVRAIIATVAVYLLLPMTIEGLLSLVLKGNAQYLPFTSAGYITVPTSEMSSIAGAVVATCWAVLFGAIGWVLFMRRDAN